MKCSFDVIAHGDLVLKCGGKSYNLGYRYGAKLPVMLWLSNMRSSRENIYQRVRINSPVRELEKDDSRRRSLDESIEEAIKLSQDTSLSLESFNGKVMGARLSNFTSGSNQVFYEFELKKDKNLYLNYQSRNPKCRGRLILNPSDVKELSKRYRYFLPKARQLEVDGIQVPYAVSKLRIINPVRS